MNIITTDSNRVSTPCIIPAPPFSRTYILFSAWQYEMWRTVYSGSVSDEYRLSPREPGEYTWPLHGATGYYSTIFAGPLPPLECQSTVPDGYFVVGCFADSKKDRLLNTEFLEVITRGPDGMTAKVILKQSNNRRQAD